MLLRDQPYQDLGPDWLAQRNDQARTRKLVAELERLGHTSSSTPQPDLLRSHPPDHPAHSAMPGRK